MLSFDDEFVGDVDVGDLDDVGAYAFNGAIYKDIVAATPTINIFCLFNLFVKLRARISQKYPFKTRRGIKIHFLHPSS